MAQPLETDAANRAPRAASLPTRILFLNTRNECGADVAVHLSLMKSLAAEEAKIFVLSNSEASDAAEMGSRFAGMAHVSANFLRLGKPADALAGKSALQKTLAYGPSAASLMQAAAFVWRNGVQIIHATDRPRDASYASILGRLTGAASVVHMHSHVGDHHTRPTLWGMRHATAIFAVSEYTRKGLGRMGIDLNKIHTVHNAVDADHFDPEAKLAGQPGVRQQYGVPEKVPLVGIAARMNPWKGQRELIEAAALLRDAYPDLHVMILGASEPVYQAQFQLSAERGGVADRVHFVGLQQDVRPFLKEFDVFVHPSYGEPFGLAIAEAMAMEKPVIACNDGGVPEIITHGKDGWLVAPRSSQAVAEALTILLDRSELRQQLGKNARQTIRARFSARQQSAVVAQRYASLIASA